MVFSALYHTFVVFAIKAPFACIRCPLLPSLGLNNMSVQNSYHGNKMVPSQYFSQKQYCVCWLRMGLWGGGVGGGVGGVGNHVLSKWCACRPTSMRANTCLRVRPASIYCHSSKASLFTVFSASRNIRSFVLSLHAKHTAAISQSPEP